MKKHSATILIVDDDEHVVFTGKIILKEYFENIEVLTSPKTLESRLRQNDVHVVLLDMNFKAGVTSGNEGIFWMNRILTLSPQTQVVLQTAFSDIELAVKSIKEGAVDFLPKPWDKEKLIDAMLTAYKLACVKRETKDGKYKRGANVVQHQPDFIAMAPSMQPVMHAIAQVASTSANVLILGENGTGKELVARAIHSQSPRCNEPFVSVDLGAIPATLFESEMFGHEKGAFTDAKEMRPGKCEQANKGTLFLDEIANLPLELQVKLLSVLQTRMVTRIGSGRNTDLDIRVISATNASHQELTKREVFRQDLFYRINTVTIQLPALRDRREDIPVLVRHYLGVFCSRYNKSVTIDDHIVKDLSNYHWPGNIRELQHAVERAVILCAKPELALSDFSMTTRTQSYEAKYRAPALESLNLSHVEKDVIRQALKKCQGNLTKTAEELGIGRTTLYRKMEEYGIN